MTIGKQYKEDLAQGGIHSRDWDSEQGGYINLHLCHTAMCCVSMMIPSCCYLPAEEHDSHEDQGDEKKEAQRRGDDDDDELGL